MGNQEKKKVSETKNWFSEKNNIIGKPLVRLTKEKITSIRNERWDITIAPQSIKSIVKEYMNNSMPTNFIF